ncbi:hypothetical protein [Bacillus wiedmannii]|uniref:hypothetical protein n=1 Tax=Bacillus wiedmannii TaxID=1890302 RepID=UPI000BEF2415|nr:hypothetical protein [Bacillus wiedmannii]PEL51555.1 hypothetical protein CN622_30215 [Bacillus wiedmannii]PEO05792.1 hypothetical protein CN562_29620 [Bacillus wiedmannii]PEP99150.1 hypothetical protein CN587_29750 [Bacillus wiedmannii]
MSDMEVLKLPIKKPAIISYQFLAFPLAILANYKNLTEPWVQSNFSQICVNTDFDHPVPFCFYMFDYTINPWLLVEKIERETIKTNDIDILEFIKNSIRQEKYVYLCLNEFYVPDRAPYQTYDLDHDVLITGFDNKKNTLNILGFDKQMLFKETTISFNQFLDAYKMFKSEDNSYLNKIVLYKFNKNGEYSFNKSLVIESLSEYLYSKNTSERFNMLTEPWDRVYGLECYKLIRLYIDKVIQNEINLNIRDMHVLYEHKLSMYNKIKYMEDNGVLKEEFGMSEAYKKVKSLSESIRNTMLKYSINQKTNLLQRVKELLIEIEEKESYILHELLIRLKIK